MFPRTLYDKLIKVRACVLFLHDKYYRKIPLFFQGIPQAVRCMESGIPLVEIDMKNRMLLLTLFFTDR